MGAVIEMRPNGQLISGMALMQEGTYRLDGERLVRHGADDSEDRRTPDSDGEQAEWNKLQQPEANAHMK